MNPSLPEAFRRLPLAHRGLHDIGAGRPENSFEAVAAAVEKGYGIEVDVQLSSDGQAMVFHDYDMDRLTLETGALRARAASDLGVITLKGGQRGIPKLAEVLEIVGGRVPLLIEIKDQDGALGPNVGALEEAVSQDIDGYEGPLAVMSFNPHSVFRMRSLSSEVPRGLVTDAFDSDEWPAPESVLVELRRIADYDRVGASFISHDARDLDRARVTELKNDGATILCWTIRSPEAEAAARQIADNVTFEGYLPPTDAA